MALIKCADCGIDVSDSANACPKCGKPTKVRKNRTGEAVLSTLLGLGGCWMWFGSRGYLMFPYDTAIIGGVLLLNGIALFAKRR